MSVCMTSYEGLQAKSLFTYAWFIWSKHHLNHKINYFFPSLAQNTEVVAWTIVHKKPFRVLFMCLSKHWTKFRIEMKGSIEVIDLHLFIKRSQILLSKWNSYVTNSDSSGHKIFKCRYLENYFIKTSPSVK